MLVNIYDDPDNWRKWGDLVRQWVSDPTSRPATTDAMNAQIVAAGINGSVPGPARAVQFFAYNDGDGPLYFPLPTERMITAAETNLAGIAAQSPGQRRYPLQSFYAIAFGGAPQADLALGEMLALERRRLGEYVILECQ